MVKFIMALIAGLFVLGRVEGKGSIFTAAAIMIICAFFISAELFVFLIIASVMGLAIKA